MSMTPGEDHPNPRRAWRCWRSGHGRCQPPCRRGREGGFTVIEGIVAATMIMVLTSLSINAAINQWRGEQSYAVAEELAGWLVLVQRAAMRGVGCTVSIASVAGEGPASSATVRVGDTLARVVQASGGSPTTSCTAYSPMQLETASPGSSFLISPTNVTFTFTPRGTLAGASSDPLVITIANQAGGGARCVRLDGLLGLTRQGTLEGSGSSATCQ
ncbi:MAG: hypothetical protein ACKOZT_07585 [Cyanobium sp.]